ncbi:MAG TPA: ABC transporter substrate-binding protein, partial [Acidimicrobiales bacterium]
QGERYVTPRTRSQRALLLRLAALLAIVTFIGAACGGGDDDEDAGGEEDAVERTDTKDEGTPKAGGSVSMALEAESAGWQPCVDSFSESGTMVMRAIYDPLTSRDSEGEVKPFLAESIEPNADATEWTLKLRSGVKFHDGTALDSAVLKHNFDAAKQPASRCFGALAPIKEMQVVDPLTVKYVMTSPYGPFPELLATSYPFSPTNADKRGKDVSANPVGTGPFVFDSWERDSKLVVKKNPNYWQKGLPYLDQVTFRPIPDEDARLAAVQSGEVDMMHTLRQQYVKSARDLGDEVERYEFVGNNCGGSIFNTVRPPVDDKRVRKALAYAMNQEELIAILGGEGISPGCTQFFSEDSPWYSEKVAKAYPQNKTAEAKKLIDAYKNDEARSDKKPVGSEVAVEFNCPPDPTLVAVAQGYQQQATAAGIKMNLNQVEQATHINNAVGKAPFTDADYMINCWRLGAQSDPDTVLFTQYADPNGQAANVTNFNNKQVQTLLQQGREETDFEKRKAIYEQIHEIFNDEVPHVWTGATVTSVVTKKNIRGVEAWKFPNGDKGSGAENSGVRFLSVWVGE